MSWAANRCTTRVEDLSYCLFGIFDVNLPLIYEKDPELLSGCRKLSHLRTTIFLFSRGPPPQEPDQFEFNNYSTRGADLKHNHCQLIWGIFATSPSEFFGCGNIERINNPSVPSEEFTMTNKGFHISTRLGHGNGEYYMDLQSRDSTTGLDQVIRLLNISDGSVRHHYPPGYSQLRFNLEFSPFL